MHERIVDEVADLAVAAATEDPRFPPVSLEELSGISVEISLLSEEERIRSAEELDPASTASSSGRSTGGDPPSRIEGIDTPEQQLRAVLRKGDIPPSEAYKMFRFSVVKVSE